MSDLYKARKNIDLCDIQLVELFHGVVQLSAHAQTNYKLKSTFKEFALTLTGRDNRLAKLVESAFTQAENNFPCLKAEGLGEDVRFRQRASQIVQVLKQRFQAVQEVLDHKKQSGLPASDPKRHGDVIGNAVFHATEIEADPVGSAIIIAQIADDCRDFQAQELAVSCGFEAKPVVACG